MGLSLLGWEPTAPDGSWPCLVSFSPETPGSLTKRQSRAWCSGGWAACPGPPLWPGHLQEALPLLLLFTNALTWAVQARPAVCAMQGVLRPWVWGDSEVPGGSRAWLCSLGSGLGGSQGRVSVLEIVLHVTIQALNL